MRTRSAIKSESVDLVVRVCVRVQGYFGAVGCLLKLLDHGPEPESDRTGLASPPADATTPIDPLDMIATRARLTPDEQPRITISPFFPAPVLLSPAAAAAARTSSDGSGSTSTTTSSSASACPHCSSCSSSLVASTSPFSSASSSTDARKSSTPGSNSSSSNTVDQTINRGGS